MKSQNKSGHCLRNAFNVFRDGDVESAIRRLNITFNHTTNTDWSPADIQQILSFLSWLYFYECRFEKVASILERAIEHCSRGSNEQRQFLPHMHYNLAECYNRMDERLRCEANFRASLKLLDETLGKSSRSYQLVEHRYKYLRAARLVTEKLFAPAGSDAHYADPSQPHRHIAAVHSLADRKLQLVRM